MFTSLTLFAIAGGALRLAVGIFVYRRFSVSLTVPQALAGSLVVLAGLPDFLKPVPFPLPLGLVAGFLLPDLLFARSAK